MSHTAALASEIEEPAASRPRTYEEWIAAGEGGLDPLARRWLEPLSIVGKAASAALWGMNWLGMRLCFRLQSEGLEHVPSRGPFILAPNHSSTLDPLALAAVLPYSLLKQTHWAGRKGAVLRNPLRRVLNRLTRTIPIDRDLSALAAAAAALKRGQALVWFPEGTRSADGELQAFKPGVGMLMHELRVPVVPAYLHGVAEALPPQHTLPKLFRTLRVSFGPPLSPADLPASGDAAADIERLTAEVRRRVERLRNAALRS